jgi:hypothetical protein
MAIQQDLFNQIQAALAPAIGPSLTNASDACDLFEAYILTLVIRAAVEEGATISYEGVTGSVPSVFTFRTSPGDIFSNHRDYTHAILQFPNKPELEAHIGIMVQGRSKVLHECDVAVLYRTEAETCRQSNAHPRHSKVLLSVECKCYTSRIPLHLGRAFLGLMRDLSTLDRFFVCNRDAPSVKPLIAAYTRAWEQDVHPLSPGKVDDLLKSFKATFKSFCSKR